MRRKSRDSQALRRIRLVNPRFQGDAAILVAAVAAAAASTVGVLLYRDLRQVFWDASFQGHYGLSAPYRIAGGILIARLLALFGATFAGGCLCFLWYVRRIRKGIVRIVGALDASKEGDLTSPTDIRGLGGLAELAGGVDRVRSHTFGLIGEVRADVETMRMSALPPDEFAKRWEALKEKIGRIAP